MAKTEFTLTGTLTAPSLSEPAYGGYLKFTADKAPAPPASHLASPVGLPECQGW